MATLPKTTATPTHKVIRSLIYLIFGMLLLATAPGLRAQGPEKEFKFGSRPHDGIFDPAGILLSKQREEIAVPLAKVLKNEGIDVLVIILPEIGDAPAKHVAQGFREEWSDTPINAVALHVPGNPESPWIFPGDVINRLVKAEKLLESVDAGEKRAAAEADDFGRIRAASVEAADIMRFWTGGAVLRTESLISERETRELAFENRRRLIKLAAMVGLAGAIPIIAGLVFFLGRLKKTGPRNFPPVRKIPRLGAPYAGGNHAVSRIK